MYQYMVILEDESQVIVTASDAEEAETITLIKTGKEPYTAIRMGACPTATVGILEDTDPNGEDMEDGQGVQLDPAEDGEAIDQDNKSDPEGSDNIQGQDQGAGEDSGSESGSEGNEDQGSQEKGEQCKSESQQNENSQDQNSTEQPDSGAETTEQDSDNKEKDNKEEKEDKNKDDEPKPKNFVELLNQIVDELTVVTEAVSKNRHMIVLTNGIKCLYLYGIKSNLGNSGGDKLNLLTLGEWTNVMKRLEKEAGRPIVLTKPKIRNWAVKKALEAFIKDEVHIEQVTSAFEGEQDKFIVRLEDQPKVMYRVSVFDGEVFNKRHPVIGYVEEKED